MLPSLSCVVRTGNSHRWSYLCGQTDTLTHTAGLVNPSALVGPTSGVVTRCGIVKRFAQSSQLGTVSPNSLMMVLVCYQNVGNVASVCDTLDMSEIPSHHFQV